MKKIDNCEIAVIGSGPGGSITAYHLAKAGKNVRLIEEGVHATTPPFSLKELRLKYRNKGQTLSFGTPKVQYVEGCCIGGGSEINSGLYHRLPEEIRHEWQKRLQIAAFSSEDLEPHYDACEERLSIQLSKSPSRASNKLAEGASALGWNCVQVPRWYDAFQTRFSMSNTFIPAFLEAGGILSSETRVSKIQRERDRWVLETSKNLISAKTVFVCAGAIQTPALLRHSGIKRNIGNQLALHPTIKLTAWFDEEINGEESEIPTHQVKEFSPALSLGGSISSLPHLMAAFAQHPDFPNWFLQNWKHLFSYYAMISPHIEGKVRVIPGCASPLVTYKMGKKEREQLAWGQKKLAELLFIAGAKALFATDGSRFTQLSDLPNSINRGYPGIMTIHLCGSCPMGENRDLCATNSFGKVHGTEGLYISDASLLGGSPTVNPQGIIMAIARRNAFNFLEAVVET